MKVTKLIFLVSISISALSGCSSFELDPVEEVIEEVSVAEDATSLEELRVPDGFNFENNKKINITIEMPNSIDFSEYRSRFSIYSDSISDLSKLLISGSFDESGRFNDVFTVPFSQNKLYLKTLVTDSLIPLSTSRAAFENITIDLKELYNQIPVDSFPVARSSKKPTFSKQQISVLENWKTSGLINGDFEVDDFDLNPNGWSPFTPESGRWNFMISNRKTPMNWYSTEENSFVGTTDIGIHEFGISQTFAVTPGDLITFNAQIKAVSSNGISSFYRVLARRENGGVLYNATLQYSFPAYDWTTKTVVVTMPEGTAYCTVEAIGGDWTADGRILFDNFSITGISDQDGDGVEDEYDDYPNDADKAYDYYFPNKTDYGTLAFEDTWPRRGDYDFNDLVVDYKFKQILNADNEMVGLDVDYKFKAAGASFKNGFGFQMDLDPSLVASVTGASLEEGIITTMGNGTEAGQEKATIIVTDNVFNVLPYSGGGTGTNTTQGAPYVEPVSVNISIAFTAPVTIAQTGYAPYNPFMIINRNRGKEVHLPGYAPTSLADTSFFGTGEDDTDLALGKYYLTDKNLPWAINLPESFDYPAEGFEILEGYVHFGRWAQSRGFSFMDWYMKKTGYQNSPKIFSK